MLSFFNSYERQKKGVTVIDDDSNFAFSLKTPYSIEEHGLIWAKHLFLQYGQSLKKIVTIDCDITQGLKEFLNGQTQSDGEKMLLSDAVMKASTVAIIAQDISGDILSLDFVEAMGGCGFKSIVEQDID